MISFFDGIPKAVDTTKELLASAPNLRKSLLFLCCIIFNLRGYFS
jgi:hypothetical protein